MRHDQSFAVFEINISAFYLLEQGADVNFKDRDGIQDLWKLHDRNVFTSYKLH